MEGEKTTATNITPHPRKMGVKRRFTGSPATELHANGLENGSKRLKVTTRSSLPGNASQEDGKLIYLMEEREFAPLREVLKDRMKAIVQSKKDEEIEREQQSDEMMVLDKERSSFIQEDESIVHQESKYDAKIASDDTVTERYSQSQSQQAS